MIHSQYYVEQAKLEKLQQKKNTKSSFYNGIYDRYVDPVLTREHIPVTWKYDIDAETNPYFMERLGVNAVMNSGAIELNGKFYLVARVEGNDRKSFFAVAESDNGVDGFKFWDYPIQLPDTCPEETNVYDMRLTKHEDGYIYGVFCSESKDKDDPDLSAAVAEAGIVRTKDLKTWERLDNLKTLQSPQQREQQQIILHRGIQQTAAPVIQLVEMLRMQLAQIQQIQMVAAPAIRQVGTLTVQPEEVPEIQEIILAEIPAPTPGMQVPAAVRQIRQHHSVR